MDTYPIALTGGALLVAVAAVILAIFARRRSRVAERHLEQNRREDDVDRQRLRTTLERSQLEVNNTNAELLACRAECTRLRQELEEEATRAQATHQELVTSEARHTTLLTESRSQKAHINALTSTLSALNAEKRLLDETKKALAISRSNVETAQTEAAEAKKQLLAEHLRLADKDKQLKLTQAELSKLRDANAKLAADLNTSREHLATARAREANFAQLEHRNTELERELEQVVQVASTVNAVELDREELQVRLETAALSVRLARKEAERFRTDANAIQAETDRLRSELSTLRKMTLEQEHLAAENAELVEERAHLKQRFESLQSDLDETRIALQATESRATDATAELQRVTQALEKSRLDRQELAVKLESIALCAKQAEQLRVEVAALTQADERRRTAEADVLRLTTELRANQSALRNTQSAVAELEHLRNTADLLREERQSHIEAEQRISSLQAELRTVKGGVAATHSKRVEAEQLEQLRNENHSLREDIAKLRVHERASAELEQLTIENKRLRLESELLARRVAELPSLQEELSDLRQKSATQANLIDESRRLYDALGQLEAQIYALGQTPQTKLVNVSFSPVAIGTKAHELESTLLPVLEHSRLRSVVLADASGFPVVATGDALAQEGLAAFSALAGQIAQSARRLLPIGTVRLINLVDNNRTVVSCRLFSLEHEEFAVSAIGGEAMDLRQSDDAVSALQQSMTATLALNDGPSTAEK